MVGLDRPRAAAGGSRWTAGTKHRSIRVISDNLGMTYVLDSMAAFDSFEKSLDSIDDEGSVVLDAGFPVGAVSLDRASLSPATFYA